MSAVAETANCPDAGIYPRVPFKTYREWDAMNMSTLLEGMVSMEHLQAAIEGQLFKDSPALNFGRAFHARILEPDVYREEWSVAGQCSAKVGSGKRKGEQCENGGSGVDDDGNWFCGVHGKGLDPPEQCISADEANKIEAIARKLKGHKAVRLLRANGGFETSMVWEYRGVKFKGRLDKYIQGSKQGDIILDPKKVGVRRGGFDAFGKAIVDYNYHVRAAAYVLGAEILTGLKPTFIWIAIEDSHPHSIGVYQLGEQEFAVGKYHLDRLIDGYKLCQSTGYWPGYSDSVKHARLPGWYMHEWSKVIEQIEQAEDM